MTYEIEELLEGFKRDNLRYIDQSKYEFQDLVTDLVRRFAGKLSSKLEMEGVRLPYIEEFLYDNLRTLGKIDSDKVFDQLVDNIYGSNRKLTDVVSEMALEKGEQDQALNVSKINNAFMSYNETPSPGWIESRCEDVLQELTSKYRLRENYELLVFVKRNIGSFSDELIQEYTANMAVLNKRMEERLEELNRQIGLELIKKETEVFDSTKTEREELDASFLDDPSEEELEEIRRKNRSAFISEPTSNKTPEELVQEKYNQMANVLNDPSLTQEEKDKLCDQIEEKYDSQINTVREKKEVESLESLFL